MFVVMLIPYLKHYQLIREQIIKCIVKKNATQTDQFHNTRKILETEAKLIPLTTVS